MSCVNVEIVRVFVNLLLHNYPEFRADSGTSSAMLIGSERVVDKLSNAILSESDYNVEYVTTYLN